MIRVALLLAAAAAASGLAAQPLGNDEYRAHMQRVQAEYEAARERCRPLEDNARDLCKVRARGVLHVAKAELRAQFKPGPANLEKVALARAEAGYAVAKEQCDNVKGHAREVCRKDAKAAFAAARAQAKSARSALAQAEKSQEAPRRSDEARADPSAALYAAGRQRCDTLAGAAREQCLADLRQRFGRP